MKTIIDTSAWISVLRLDQDKSMVKKINDLLTLGEGYWCGMIRLELNNGVRIGKELRDLNLLYEVVPSLEINEFTFKYAEEIARDARQKGVTIPSSDILIYACATQNEAQILHLDKHFTLLDKL